VSTITIRDPGVRALHRPWIPRSSACFRARRPWCSTPIRYTGWDRCWLGVDPASSGYVVLSKVRAGSKSVHVTNVVHDEVTVCVPETATELALLDVPRYSFRTIPPEVYDAIARWQRNVRLYAKTATFGVPYYAPPRRYPIDISHATVDGSFPVWARIFCVGLAILRLALRHDMLDVAEARLPDLMSRAVFWMGRLRA